MSLIEGLALLSGVCEFCSLPTPANPPLPSFSLYPRRDSYLPGVQALARSLAAVRARHPLLVMHTPDTLSAAAAAAVQQEPGCQLLAVEWYMPAGKGAALLAGWVAAAAAAAAVAAGSGGIRMGGGCSCMRPGTQAAPAHPPCPSPAGIHNFGAYKMECYAECWTKLRMWQLEEYDRSAVTGRGWMLRALSGTLVDGCMGG